MALPIICSSKIDYEDVLLTTTKREEEVTNKQTNKQIDQNEFVAMFPKPCIRRSDCFTVAMYEELSEGLRKDAAKKTFAQQ